MQGEEAKYQNHILVAVILFLVATAVTIIQYKIPTVMSPIMTQFDIDANTASWLMSVFTFVGIIVALPTGFLAQRLGPKAVMLAAIAIDIVAALVGAFTSNVGVLIATRAFEGVAIVFVVACGPIVIQRCVDPAKRGTATGIWMLGGMLGATFAGVFTPTLYYSTGFVGLWLAYGAVALIAGLLLMFVIRVPKDNLFLSADIDGNVSTSAMPVSEKSVFFKINTWLFFIPFALFQMMLLTVLSYTPSFMQQQGMDATMSGLISTLPMLLAILSSTAFGAIADKTQRCKPLCVIGMLVMGPCAFVMLNTTGSLMWVAVVIMGLLAMGTPAVFVTAYPRILGNPALLSVGMGVLLLMQSVGQFLGTFVSSNLLGPDLSGWFVCGLVTMVLGFVGTVSIAFCRFK